MSEVLLLEKTNANTLDNELKSRLLSKNLYYEIIESETFKRLKNIHFLGAIDYLYKNKKRHTRYEHTLSVARLAVRYSELTKLKYDEEKYLVVAALLHDIGHGPLSHSMEPSFKKLFKLTHHSAGTNIILGKSPLGSEIFSILNKYNIELDKLIKLLDGKSNEKYAFALNNPINIDTIDGIVRSYTYLFSARNKNKNMSTIPNIYDILEATVRVEKQKYLDIFWELKNKVYNELINKEIHIYADNYSQRFVLNKEQDIKEEDFYLSEIEFKNKFDSLFVDLKNLSKIKEKETSLNLEYMNRLYKISSSKSVSNIAEYATKYIYTKEKDIFTIKQSIEKTQKTLI
ncbi:MAG: HD domain-containing protein [Sulfurovum sp.]|nr:HD domain-containing protein [Sulfurovum sp.]